MVSVWQVFVPVFAWAKLATGGDRGRDQKQRIFIKISEALEAVFAPAYLLGLRRWLFAMGGR